MSLYSKCLLMLFFSCRLQAADFEFATDSFQLGRWNPKTLTYEHGLRKMEALDKWFNSLPESEKSASRRIYNLNRNRLFLVTQEKRLKAEVEQTESLFELAKDKFQPSWQAAGRNVLKKDALEQYSNFNTMNSTALDDEKALSSRMLRSLADIQKINLKGVGTKAFAPSFAKSVSKSSGGEMESMWRTPSQSASDLFASAGLVEFGACKKDDQDCLERKAVGKDNGKAGQFLGELSALRPACQQPKSFANSLEGNELSSFKKQRDAFLKSVGGLKWKPGKSENDLSRWYSEPISQWSKGVPNAKCVGHAVSSDIASVVNKKSIINYVVSPHSTYAQIQVITREDLVRKKSESSISPYEQAILEQIQDVKSLDSKHAQFCNSSYYQVDEYLGSALINNSLKHVFEGFQRKPLCASRDLATSEEMREAPLFTVDKFESMEFESPDKHALDYDFFRQMIDTGNPPVVMIDSDARTESEDWIHIQRSGRLKHALNVVGYGEEVDPITLCKVRYLKVRDSLGQKKIHYKVPADNFIAHVLGVYKVTSVKKAN